MIAVNFDISSFLESKNLVSGQLISGIILGFFFVKHTESVIVAS